MRHVINNSKKNLHETKLRNSLSTNQTWKLPEIKLCNTLSTIQKKKLRDIKICHTCKLRDVPNLIQ